VSPWQEDGNVLRYDPFIYACRCLNPIFIDTSKRIGMRTEYTLYVFQVTPQFFLTHLDARYLEVLKDSNTFTRVGLFTVTVSCGLFRSKSSDLTAV